MEINKSIKLNLALSKILENQGIDFKKYTKMLTIRKGKKVKKIILGE